MKVMVVEMKIYQLKNILINLNHVRDHYHDTGKHRGVEHSICDLRFDVVKSKLLTDIDMLLWLKKELEADYVILLIER